MSGIEFSDAEREEPSVEAGRPMSGVEWTAAEREAVEQALTTPEMPGLTDYGMVPVRIDSAAFAKVVLDALAPFVAAREREAAARALYRGYDARRRDLPVNPATEGQDAADWLRDRADRIEREGQP